MCAVCNAKVVKFSELSAFFRAEAREIQMIGYRTLMSEAAQALENLSNNLRQRCKCNDTQPIKTGPQEYPGAPHISNFNW